MQRRRKTAAKRTLKSFAESVNSERGAGGDGSNIGNIVSLCLTPGNSSLAADFCFSRGGPVINPIEPGLEIVPDNPDYTLDPDGLGGSGKGIIGEAPIEIPYTITYSGAQKMRRLRSR